MSAASETRGWRTFWIPPVLLGLALALGVVFAPFFLPMDRMHLAWVEKVGEKDRDAWTVHLLHRSIDGRSPLIEEPYLPVALSALIALGRHDELDRLVARALASKGGSPELRAYLRKQKALSDGRRKWTGRKLVKVKVQLVLGSPVTTSGDLEVLDEEELPRDVYFGPPEHRGWPGWPQPQASQGMDGVVKVPGNGEPIAITVAADGYIHAPFQLSLEPSGKVRVTVDQVTSFGRGPPGDVRPLRPRARPTQDTIGAGGSLTIPLNADFSGTWSCQGPSPDEGTTHEVRARGGERFYGWGARCAAGGVLVGAGHKLLDPDGTPRYYLVGNPSDGMPPEDPWVIHSEEQEGVGDQIRCFRTAKPALDPETAEEEGDDDDDDDGDDGGENDDEDGQEDQG